MRSDAKTRQANEGLKANISHHGPQALHRHAVAPMLFGSTYQKTDPMAGTQGETEIKYRTTYNYVLPATADVTGHVTPGLGDFREGQVGNPPRKLDI